jgi:raffinose/stachyose/melibiose transport system substrate-binding protein
MLTTQIQSGSVADLFSTLGLSDPQLANLVSQNLVRPMDDLVENESDWPSVDIDWYKVNGKLYACPSIFGDVEAIFYNMDIFNKYGLTLPKTWADQDKIAQTLVQNGVAPYAVSASDESSPQYYFYCLLACTQPDFVHGFPGNGQKLTDQAIIDTAKLLQDECQQGYFGDDYLAVDANGSTLDLTNGKAAMKMDGEWVTTTLSALPSQNIGTYFPPDINGDFVGNGASPNQAVNFSIYANTPNMDASVKLVQYIMGPTVQQAFADAGSGVIYNCPKAQGINAPNPLLATLAQIEMKPAVSLVSLCGPISADGANPRNVMSAAVQDLFFNKVTPEEFAKQIDTCVDYSKIGQSPYTSSGS